MPRKLPWLVDAAKVKSSRKVRSSPPPVPKRDDSPDDLVDLDLNQVAADTPKRREENRVARTPSTSPPPAPPEVEYMREGYDADDIYMMVEDEFLSTAKTFTQHLHHAEYVRFKKLAKSRGAGVLATIQRPADGRTEQSQSLRLQLEAERKAKKIKTAMKEEGDESSAEEDAYLQDPQLAGLMTGIKGVKKDLSSMTKPASNTRAAAGFSQSPRNVERTKDVFDNSKDIAPVPTSSKARRRFEEEVYSENGDDGDDDLDVACPKPSKPSLFERFRKGEVEAQDISKLQDSTHARHYSLSREDGRSGPLDGADADVESFGRRKKPSPPPSPKRAYPGNDTKRTATSDYLAKRRAEREKKERDDKQKKKAPIDVPTFAI